MENDGPETDSPVKRKNRSLDDAIFFFKSLTAHENLRGNLKVQLSLEEVVKHSMSFGLSQEHITDLLNVIISTKTKLSQSVRCKLVKCLIPASKVPQEAVVSAVLAIGSKVFSTAGLSNLHGLLLRWILLTFDYVDGYANLHKLYNVIFTFVNSYVLLPHACHLLFLLTQKHDVKLFKVHKLLELTRKVGPEPYIVGLLLIYKVYCPHLVPMSLDYGHKVFFRVHDAAWRSTIEYVVSQREVEMDTETLAHATQIRGRRDRAKVQPKSKRQKLLVPNIHSAAQEVEEEQEEEELSSCKIPYSQIDTFTSFLESLDKIQYPSQIAASLNDNNLQLLLSCDPDTVVLTRLSFWIQSVLTFGFSVNGKNDEVNEKHLKMLLTFSQNAQVLPIVQGFLACCLPTWNGQSYAPLIFSLVTCIRPASYKELFCNILAPLHRLFFCSDIYFKVMCVVSLTKLIKNLAMDIHVYPADSTRPPSSQSSQDCYSASSTPSHRPSSPAANLGTEVGFNRSVGSLGEGLDASASHRETIIHNVVNFLDDVLVVGLRVEDDHYLLEQATLDFILLMSRLYQTYDVALVCLPMQVIQRLMLSSCAGTLARLCSIINLFREALSVFWDKAASQPLIPVVNINSREVFNGLLLDMLGMLWRGQMFRERAKKFPSIFTPHLSQMQIAIPEFSLSVFRGQAFLGLAYKFLKEIGGEDTKVHPDMIKEFKEQYLQYLERENFPEFAELVNRNIKSRKSLG